MLKSKRNFQWNNPINKVVWWAPASKQDLFIDELISFQDDFENFRMFTMADSLERADILVDNLKWLYPSSLLYFISGVLEKYSDYPITGMLRFYSGQRPYSGNDFLIAKRFLEVNNRLITSQTTTTVDGFSVMLMIMANLTMTQKH